MRFIAAVLALMALFAGVRAEESRTIASVYFNVVDNNGQGSITDVRTTSADASINPGIVGSFEALSTKSKLMKTMVDDPSRPTQNYYGTVWTKFYVGNSFNNWKFDNLHICLVTGTAVDGSIICDRDYEETYKGNFYGSTSDFSSDVDLEAALLADPSALFKLSKAAIATGQPVVNAAGPNSNPATIEPTHRGLNTQNWWPRLSQDANPAAAPRFTYLYVKVIVVDANNVRGGLGISLTGAPVGGACPSGACGDPQFVGLQGQDFQFHGMADEVFSLVSSPELQMNSLFKFISSGKCDYNDTMCWSHPGTYLGQIGLQFGADKILLQSGAHSEGMKVYINDKEVSPSKHIHQFAARDNITAIAQYRASNKFSFNSDRFFINVVNSDYFFNLEFGLKDTQALLAGAKQMRVTGEICERESRMHKTLLTETKAQITGKLATTYPAYPLHGLVGQTWRNAEYCGRYYEGTVDDYVTGALFGGEHTFNNFQF